MFWQKSIKQLVATLGKVANHVLFYPTHASAPQNGPISRLEQTYSCYVPFERKISAESHFQYQKTPNKPLNQHMFLKYSAFFIFLVKKNRILHV